MGPLLTRLVLVLVKAGLGAQLGPSHEHPNAAEVATDCGSLAAPKRLLKDKYKWSQTLLLARVSPKRLRTTKYRGQL